MIAEQSLTATGSRVEIRDLAHDVEIVCEGVLTFHGIARRRIAIAGHALAECAVISGQLISAVFECHDHSKLHVPQMDATFYLTTELNSVAGMPVIVGEVPRDRHGWVHQ